MSFDRIPAFVDGMGVAGEHLTNFGCKFYSGDIVRYFDSSSLLI